MYCTRCGTQLNPGAAFCHVCGQGAAATPGTPPAPEGSGEFSATPVPPTVVGAPPVAPAAVQGPPAWGVAQAPAGAFPALPYAGFWLRVVAHLIDGAITGIAFGLIIAVVIAAFGISAFRNAHRGILTEQIPPSGPLALAQVPFEYQRQVKIASPLLIVSIVLGILASIVIAWLYYAWMESSEHQATLGKMALGLIVTDLQGRRVTFGRASGRFFAKMITGLIPLGIGYMMAGFTEKKQALHDILASCLVLRKV